MGQDPDRLTVRAWQDLELVVQMEDRTRRPEFGRRLVGFEEFLDVAFGEEV